MHPKLQLQNNTLGSLRSEVRDLMPHGRIQDIDYLLRHSLQRPRGWLYTHSEYRLKAQEKDILENSLQSYIDGVPLAQIRSWCEFYSLKFSVSPDVLVPRPETELLVEQALRYNAKTANVLDLGTGCGNIACALQVYQPGWKILASDISDKALQLARRNAISHGLLDLRFKRSDWFDNIDEKFDLIVSNPPYVGRNDCDLEQDVRRHEPALALFAPRDGLAYLQHIIVEAKQHLRGGGQLALEHGHRQSDAVCTALEEAGFVAIRRVRDYATQWRVAVACLR